MFIVKKMNSDFITIWKKNNIIIELIKCIENSSISRLMPGNLLTPIENEITLWKMYKMKNSGNFTYYKRRDPLEILNHFCEIFPSSQFLKKQFFASPVKFGDLLESQGFHPRRFVFYGLYIWFSTKSSEKKFQYKIVPTLLICQLQKFQEFFFPNEIFVNVFESEFLSRVNAAMKETYTTAYDMETLIFYFCSIRRVSQSFTETYRSTIAEVYTHSWRSWKRTGWYREAIGYNLHHF